MNRIRVVLSHEIELAPLVDETTGQVALSEKDQDDTAAYVLSSLAVHCGRGRVRRAEQRDLPFGEEALEQEVAVRIPRHRERFPDAFLKGIGILVRELGTSVKAAKGSFALQMEFQQGGSSPEGSPEDRLRVVARLIRIELP
jgi:hypothetical protein